MKFKTLLKKIDKTIGKETFQDNILDSEWEDNKNFLDQVNLPQSEVMFVFKLDGTLKGFSVWEDREEGYMDCEGCWGASLDWDTNVTVYDVEAETKVTYKEKEVE